MAVGCVLVGVFISVGGELVFDLSPIPSVHHHIVVSLLLLVAIVLFGMAIANVNVAKQQQQQTPRISIQIVSVAR